uniref:Uncharacterized protein n=1 Tax=Arundo donax TaxID=35708 RepID=A0A0A8Y3P4_ARUDO
MASNTLLPADLARRNKDHHHVDPSSAAGTNDTWKIAAAAAMSSAAAAPRAAVAAEQQHHHQGHHDAEAFSVLHDLVVTAADGGAHHHMPMSGASSLVTSLSNSREGSPDRGGGLSMLFSKPSQPAPAPSKQPMSPLMMPLGSWASPASARPAAVSIAHMPLFDAWTDA